jgi:hypothetical protein
MPEDSAGSEYFQTCYIILHFRLPLLCELCWNHYSLSFMAIDETIISNSFTDILLAAMRSEIYGIKARHTWVENANVVCRKTNRWLLKFLCRFYTQTGKKLHHSTRDVKKGFAVGVLTSHSSMVWMIWLPLPPPSN